MTAVVKLRRVGERRRRRRSTPTNRPKSLRSDLIVIGRSRFSTTQCWRKRAWRVASVMAWPEPRGGGSGASMSRNGDVTDALLALTVTSAQAQDDPRAMGRSCPDASGRVGSRAMTTLVVHTNDEAPPGARPPGATVERMRMFATAACGAEDRGHP